MAAQVAMAGAKEHQLVLAHPLASEEARPLRHIQFIAGAAGGIVLGIAAAVGITFWRGKRRGRPAVERREERARAGSSPSNVPPPPPAPSANSSLKNAIART